MCKSCRPKLAGVRMAKRSKPPDEPVKKPRSSKDTKKWCRGKVGTHHEPTWKWAFWYTVNGHSDSRVFSCDRCCKQMKFCWHSPWGTSKQKCICGFKKED